MIMREGVKTKHTITLDERTEDLLQKAYENLGDGRRLNNFIKGLIVIGLAGCADVTGAADYDSVTGAADYDSLLFLANNRNDLRPDGITELRQEIQAGLNAIGWTMPDPPRHETNIIQFPQSFVFSGGA